MSSNHFALAMMFSCGATPVMGPALSVDILDAYVQPRTPEAQTCAVFMKIINQSGENDRLLSVSSDISDDVGLHDAPENTDNALDLHRVEGGFDIADGETLTLEPQGKHIMLTDLMRPLEDINHISLTLCFEQAGMIEIDIPVDLQNPDGCIAA